ncbi:hypothetical protein C8R46DRAFT_330826 [Mycena filopes]|nr:hypothetical protein C8R46DRAFT_330826 [Mycena filopes]
MRTIQMTYLLLLLTSTIPVMALVVRLDGNNSTLNSTDSATITQSGTLQPTPVATLDTDDTVSTSVTDHPTSSAAPPLVDVPSLNKGTVTDKANDTEHRSPSIPLLAVLDTNGALMDETVDTSVLQDSIPGTTSPIADIGATSTLIGGTSDLDHPPSATQRLISLLVRIRRPRVLADPSVAVREPPSTAIPSAVAPPADDESDKISPMALKAVVVGLIIGLVAFAAFLSVAYCKAQALPPPQPSQPDLHPSASPHIFKLAIPRPTQTGGPFSPTNSMSTLAVGAHANVLPKDEDKDDGVSADANVASSNVEMIPIRPPIARKTGHSGRSKHYLAEVHGSHFHH